MKIRWTYVLLSLLPRSQLDAIISGKWASIVCGLDSTFPFLVVIRNDMTVLTEIPFYLRKLFSFTWYTSQHHTSKYHLDDDAAEWQNISSETSEFSFLIDITCYLQWWDKRYLTAEWRRWTKEQGSVTDYHPKCRCRCGKSHVMSGIQISKRQCATCDD